jgi:hypothetical protein
MNVNRRTSRTRALVVASMLPLWFAVGCGGDDSTPDGDQAGVDTAPETSAAGETETAHPSDSTATGPGEGKVTSLRETFDDDANGWALPPSDDGTTEVVDGDFVWETKQPGLRPHLIATTLGMAYDSGQLEMTNVRVTTTVTPERGAAAFGLFCREVPDTDADFQWYEFVVRDGYSAIRLADSAGNLEPIEEGDAVVPTGEVAELEVTCVDEGGEATLTFGLNGEALLEARVPEPLGNGVSGLQAYDAPAEESDERLLLAWHDFTVEPAAG